MERIKNSAVLARDERIRLQSEVLQLSTLEGQVDDFLDEMPTKAGKDLSWPDADEALSQEILGVYQLVRNHIEQLPENLTAEELMTTSEMKQVIATYFDKISTILSNPDAPRMRSMEKNPKEIGDIDNLVAVYRHKYETELEKKV